MASTASPHAGGAAALHMVTRGCDVNRDKRVNASDAAAVRSALIAAGAGQPTGAGFTAHWRRARRP